jgi:hypothetical protein
MTDRNCDPKEPSGKPLRIAFLLVPQFSIAVRFLPVFAVCQIFKISSSTSKFSTPMNQQPHD